MKLARLNIQNRGFSIIEVLISIAIFIIIGSGILIVTMGSYSGSFRTQNNFQAMALAQEAIEAVRSIKDYNWNNLVFYKQKIKLV